ncbi:MAG: AAA-like domain-containing protein [Anaerolineae bacterium]|nr:AAA-like domain-containing protein [Anaerolineae bacterium]
MNRRFFNTAGPCKSDIHYMVPPLSRLPDLHRLIEQQGYFVIHAPRQTGKTTAMQALAHDLTASGRYVAVLVSMEVGAAFNDNPGAAELAILDDWRDAIDVFLPPQLHPPSWPSAQPGQRISTALKAWSEAAAQPLVMFLDEIDALQGQTLISILRQLRAGYPRRPQSFPWSLALIGLRDVRDYKVASGGSNRLHTASPFNIKIESLTLNNFTREDVAALYQQHTVSTGQPFTPEAAQLAFDLTQGQPWLVNALAYIATQDLLPDSAEPITPDHISQAKEIMIQRQDTHLDSLAEKLQELRVRRIIEPMLAGGTIEAVPFDDRQYVLDLGLVRRDSRGGMVIANPIYREIIPRVLAGGPQDSLPLIAPHWLNSDGRLNAAKLLEAFLAFWRQHGQPLLSSAPYHEIAPHLVLMAFLHRVVNGGGTLEREYAIGSRRMDICLRYGPDTLALELKVWRDGEKDPLAEGLAQLDDYLSGLGLETGWLVIFDRRRGRPSISERTTAEHATTPSGRDVIVIRG